MPIEPVRLKDLRDNPFRDSTVDPIDERKVALLVGSINEDEFWGGVTARPSPHGGYEIAAGHHRKRAAEQTGIKSAEILVANFTDAQMVRVLVKENAMQRGDDGYASLGSVAAAVHFLARGLLTGEKSGFPDFPKNGFEVARGHLLGKQGLGVKLIAKFLKDTGLPRNQLDRLLQTLKDSGDYTRIIKEVRDDIAAEEQATQLGKEREEAARKTKTADAAVEQTSKRRKTFDLAGVRQHLEKPEHVQMFRDLVTKPTVLEVLPVGRQAALAAHIILHAKSLNKRVTGTFIRDEAFSQISAVTDKRKRDDAEAYRRQRQAEDVEVKSQIRRCEVGFTQGVRSATGYMFRLNDIEKKHPGQVKLHVSGAFVEALEHMQDILTMAKRAGIKFKSSSTFDDGPDDDKVINLSARRK